MPRIDITPDKNSQNVVGSGTAVIRVIEIKSSAIIAEPRNTLGIYGLWKFNIRLKLSNPVNVGSFVRFVLLNIDASLSLYIKPYPAKVNPPNSGNGLFITVVDVELVTYTSSPLEESLRIVM